MIFFRGGSAQALGCAKYISGAMVYKRNVFLYTNQNITNYRIAFFNISPLTNPVYPLEQLKFRLRSQTKPNYPKLLKYFAFSIDKDIQIVYDILN